MGNGNKIVHFGKSIKPINDSDLKDVHFVGYINTVSFNIKNCLKTP